MVGRVCKEGSRMIWFEKRVCVRLREQMKAKNTNPGQLG